MKIRISKRKCSGCRLCEMVCSLFHLGVINTEKSAIRILKQDLNDGMNRPVVCLQCKEMPCLEGEEATPGAEKKVFVWERARAERCPHGAVPVSGDAAFHCDLCGGKPRCVTVCTPGAIRVA